MKIFSVKSPLSWIVLVVVVFAVAGGFWYIKALSPEVEEAEIAINVERNEEVEIVLAGEVFGMGDELIPSDPKKVGGKAEIVVNPEIGFSDFEEESEDEEEVEIMFDCETGDDVEE
ncbi:hypothetical protein FACS189428_5610 [Clostridia bacterium]|nr:hypothetical protein FACS189428_5610 [Clostridia bacterium]